MGETEHLSAYRLVAVGREVVWKVSDELAVDLTRRPGHQVIAEMVDILAGFRGARGREVVRCYTRSPVWRLILRYAGATR